MSIVTAAAGCSDSRSPTSPSDTSDPTAADPTVEETFVGTLGVNDARFYAFDVAAYGTVEITVLNVGGVTGVPESVWVGIGLGVPDATDCSTTQSLNTQAGGGPHVSAIVGAGTHCARIYDIGNLAAPTPFVVRITHP